jgi:hypothetical protein
MLPNKPGFRFPPADSRTVVIGATGTGKTTFGMWLLSHARIEKRPWVFVDFKQEQMLDRIGWPPLKPLKLGQVPKKPGLYTVTPRTSDDEAVEDWLWKVWEKGNIGLFIDEASLIPDKNAFRAIMRQGRSKVIPVISCTQRPVDIPREVFTEANFVSIFRLQDVRDYKTVEGFTGLHNLSAPIEKRWSRWYDAEHNQLLLLRPCPDQNTIIDRFIETLPRNLFFGT